LGTFFQQQHSN